LSTSSSEEFERGKNKNEIQATRLTDDRRVQGDDKTISQKQGYDRKSTNRTRKSELVGRV
jgi:hypothetical protein